MDRNKIQKAWELCSQRHLRNTCAECPYHSGDEVQCIGELTRDSLALVDEQRQEIQNLRLEIESLGMASEEYELGAET